MGKGSKGVGLFYVRAHYPLEGLFFRSTKNLIFRNQERRKCVFGLVAMVRIHLSVEIGRRLIAISDYS